MTAVLVTNSDWLASVGPRWAGYITCLARRRSTVRSRCGPPLICREIVLVDPHAGPRLQSHQRWRRPLQAASVAMSEAWGADPGRPPSPPPVASP